MSFIPWIAVKLFLLTTLSVLLFVPLFISYAVISAKALTRRFRRKDESTVKTDCV